MEQNLSIHKALRSRNKSVPWPYTSSIMIVNSGVELFNDPQVDYEWLLRVTECRKCHATEPCVYRYVDGKNLSLTPEYRKRDFYMGLLEVDGDLKTMKSWFSSRARYHYVMGETGLARFFFSRGTLDWKTVLYFVTSYCSPLRKAIVKKFKVFG